MKIICKAILIFFLFTTVSYSQDVNKDNFVQFCENIEATGLSTKKLMDEILEIEEPTQTTWFVRSSLVDFHVELIELKSYCKILDLIDRTKFDMFFEKVNNDFNDKVEINSSILEQMVSLEGKFGDEKLNMLIKRLISYRKEFYK